MPSSLLPKSSILSVIFTLVPSPNLPYLNPGRINIYADEVCNPCYLSTGLHQQTAKRKKVLVTCLRVFVSKQRKERRSPLNYQRTYKEKDSVIIDTCLVCTLHGTRMTNCRGLSVAFSLWSSNAFSAVISAIPARICDLDVETALISTICGDERELALKWIDIPKN